MLFQLCTKKQGSWFVAVCHRPSTRVREVHVVFVVRQVCAVSAAVHCSSCCPWNWCSHSFHRLTFIRLFSIGTHMYNALFSKPLHFFMFGQAQKACNTISRHAITVV